MPTEPLEVLARAVRQAMEAAHASDTDQELRVLAEVRDSHLGRAIEDAVARAFAEGKTEQWVADVLGVTQQAVNKRFGHLRPRKRE